MPSVRTLVAIVGLAAVVAGCSGSPSPASSPGPTPTPAPVLTLPELKLALIDRFGQLWYCDPDVYPIARQDELVAARERWPEMVADTEAFAAITASLDLDPSSTLDDAQALLVYRAWKVLNAIALDPIGDDGYRFDYLAQPAGGAAEGTRTGGTISPMGTITVEQQAAAGEPMCPICLARGTGIETPAGPRTVESLRIGDPVWTLDLDGSRIATTVTAIGSTAVPADHEVIRLSLADGRTVTASAGHPLADGRLLGGLQVHDPVDGSIVAALARVAYPTGRTYDIAVGGQTGTYFVDGIPLGSTLEPASGSTFGTFRH